MKTVESIPNAIRTFEALRSLGYNLNSSIADIIDNAITERVKAKIISVILKRSNKGFLCRIKDDGSGMSSRILEEAMRIGAESFYGEEDLGKFGMGMKTASLSHCNVLTVISKTKRKEIAGYRWDLSHVKETHEWSLLQLNQKEIEDVLNKEKLSIQVSGTIVFWDEMFLLDQEYNSYDNKKFANNYYFRILGNLKLYLGMVYQRFIDGKVGSKRTIKIDVNKDVIHPWDPFCRKEEKTKQVVLKDEQARFTFPSYKKPIKIKAYVLPNRDAFSSEKAWKDAKGLLSWNDAQGYYIYRANRLIRYGGWQATKAKDEHDKLARVCIDIDPSHDDLFRITVNKSKLEFPDNLFIHLRSEVNPKIVKEAQKRYRKSDEGRAVSPKLKKEYKIYDEVKKDILTEYNIQTEKNGQNKVVVINPHGQWTANKIDEFIKYGTSKDYEIVFDEFKNNHLWKMICNVDEKFKLIINRRHPFYAKIYDNSSSKSLMTTISAFLFSLSFAELYSKNESNAQNFEVFKSMCSMTLDKLISKEVI